MTSQTGKDRVDWRRAVIGAVASGVLAVGLMSGMTVSTAFAQPAEPTETETPTAEASARAPGESCTGDDCKRQSDEAPKVNGDQILNQIFEQYRQGDGGGQISTLIDDAMKLRAQGYRPSNANAEALADGLARRPNQTPLVEALKNTITYQRKLQAQAAMRAQQQGPVAGPVPVFLPNGGIVPIGPR